MEKQKTLYANLFEYALCMVCFAKYVISEINMCMFCSVDCLVSFEEMSQDKQANQFKVGSLMVKNMSETIH